MNDKHLNLYFILIVFCWNAFICSINMGLLDSLKVRAESYVNNKLKIKCILASVV